MISAPSAMRSRSRWTAAIILRSSASMSSTISAAGSLSMPSVAELIASVGSACHFERNAILEPRETRGVPAARRVIVAQPGARLVRTGEACCKLSARAPRWCAPEPWQQSSLRHRRPRPAGTSSRCLPGSPPGGTPTRRTTLESYGRDLVLLARYAAGREVAIEALTRADLEAFTRELMAGGLAARSVARAVACVRGFYRYLAIGRRIAESPADDLHAPRSWAALPKDLGRRAGGHPPVATRRRDPARPSRPRADRIALRDRAAGVGTCRR